MAHFAELDNNNVVLRVIVVKNDVITDSDGKEQESLGIAFCKSLFGNNTNWKQASYNNNFRGKMPSVGATYDVEKDIFIGEQPYPSWVLDENNIWVSPIGYPEDDSKKWEWNEEKQQWDLLTPQEDNNMCEYCGGGCGGC